ncbi:MAG: SPFH domain-containing protein [Candidatus Schekmanbacteria bacterium]|nr:SPFH domain-containing protein [Candidatus Schekmanbacteria bacterium]
MKEVRETKGWKVNGFAAAAVVFFLMLFDGRLIRDAARLSAADQRSAALVVGIGAALLMLAWGLAFAGFFVVQPNEARVLVFLGKYAGSVSASGFWWTNPLTAKKHVSLRVRNFNSERLKVNDAIGNPIEIAAVVVWRVTDSARALFDVDNYETFVGIQSETAIRGLASKHPYDSHDGEEATSLRGSPVEIAEGLRAEMQARLSVAGVEVMDTRITHLAYAQEIAQAMLRRQQAHAIIAARQKIVEGAVGMVQMALRMLDEQRLVNLDEERKAAMVNNLLVALVSEREAQPIINTGTLYA